jgi:hypothetical protein
MSWLLCDSFDMAAPLLQGDSFDMVAYLGCFVTALTWQHACYKVAALTWWHVLVAL